MKIDERDVRKAMEVITSWRNPFELSEELISSGYIANDNMKQDPFQADEKGRTVFMLFVKDLLTISRTGFFATLQKLKL